MSHALWPVTSTVRLIRDVIVHSKNRAPLQMWLTLRIVTILFSQNLTLVIPSKKDWYRWKNTTESCIWSLGPDVDSSLKALKVRLYSRRFSGRTKCSSKSTIWLLKKITILVLLFHLADQRLWSKPWHMPHRIFTLWTGISNSLHKLRSILTFQLSKLLDIKKPQNSRLPSLLS